jgi:hypothetical protein
MGQSSIPVFWSVGMGGGGGRCVSRPDLEGRIHQLDEGKDDLFRFDLKKEL